MNDCGCRKGVVVTGCTRHSIVVKRDWNRFTSNSPFIPVYREPVGWWHRLLIWLSR